MSGYTNYLELTRFLCTLDGQAREAGIRIELRTDFGHFVELCETLPDKPFPTAMFNPMKSDIGPANGFWLKGTDQRGEVVHTQAMRVDDLSGTNLCDQFESLRAFYADPSLADPRERCKSFAPMGRRITGTVCYHGELWLRGGPKGWRGRSLELPGTLTRLALAIALGQWRPDFVYAFAYPTHAARGMPSRYGYWHTQPNAVYWVRPDRNEPLDVWLMWLTREDLVELMRPMPEKEYLCAL